MESQITKKVKIGIVANEFFDAKIGGFGGFGWLAREAVFCLQKFYGDTVDVVFLCGNFGDSTEGTTSYDVRVLFPEENWPAYVKKVQDEKIDLLLTIDYRPNYDYAFASLPDTPIVLWIQDPRPPEDIDKVNSLKIPHDPSASVKGIDPIDCTPLRGAVEKARVSGRKIIFASPAPQLITKVKGTYDLTLTSSDIEFLPYPLDINPIAIEKAAHPRVVFLGRLDPIKRLWVFVELAKFFPDVEFCLLGKSHFEGEGVPTSFPANVRFLGHIDGEEKQKILSSASILVNTSIHEALPVSFLEALEYEMPIVSCQNPEDVVSRFGFYTGRFDGDGLEGLPKFAEGLKWLLADQSLRQKLGKEGREWVESNHTQKRFYSIFKDLYEQAKPADQKAISAFPEPWGIPEEIYKCYRTSEEILKTVPKGVKLTLIDENLLPVHHLENYTILPFIQKDGCYFGPPEDDDAAIAELERQIQQGSQFLIIAFPAFWYHDHYLGFRDYLGSNFIQIQATDNLVIYHLAAVANELTSDSSKRRLFAN